MKIQDVLSELEKSKLSQVANDKVVLEAIKKVVLSCVYFDGTLNKEGMPEPLKNFCLAIAAEPNQSNESIGARMRASLAGVQLLETGFKELEKFGVSPDYAKAAKNPAR